MSEIRKDRYARHYADFITVTCLEWTHVLQDDRFKNIIVESLAFLSKERRIEVYAFVIMSNHFHLIWQMLGKHERQDVQRDFLKFTSQQILKIFRNEKSTIQEQLRVDAKDRKFQVWERNPLSVPLWSKKVIDQKLEYIHYNPVSAGLCKYPEDYFFSSASFYYRGDKRWNFLVHCDG